MVRFAAICLYDVCANGMGRTRFRIGEIQIQEGQADVIEQKRAGQAIGDKVDAQKGVDGQAMHATGP